MLRYAIFRVQMSVNRQGQRYHIFESLGIYWKWEKVLRFLFTGIFQILNYKVANKLHVICL